MQPVRSSVATRFILLTAILTATLSLTGCKTMAVAFGLRVNLAKIPVTSMEPSLPPNDPGIAPGQKIPLIVDFQQPSGKPLATSGKGKGKVMWSDLTLTPTVVTADKKGNILLPHDPRVSDGKIGHVTITVPSHPTLTAELDVPVNYNYPFTSTYAGASGSNGTDGNNGQDGSAGSDGSTDPNNPSPGGNGGDGTSGTDGSDGGPGGDGPAVHVVMTLRTTGPHPLLQFGVMAAGHKERFYLVDPDAGSLTVASDGGSGGKGGAGGRGGSGGSGGSGIPPGSSGNSGSNGTNGSDGSDGNGGPITVTYDPSVQPYLSRLRLSNPGGPAPTFEQATVAPLW